MNMGSKDKKRTFLDSVINCLEGINYTIIHENNFKREIILGITVIIFAFLLHISKIEWIIVILLIAIVLVCELFNTAIEKTVDLCTLKYNNIAKNAKDVSGAAVLVMCIFASIIGFIIFIPKIIDLLGRIL